jgi:hypothetical protein
MRSLLFVLLLAGCTHDIQLTYYTDTCYDWDLNSPEPELRIQMDGANVILTRMGVEEDCSATFQPEIQAAGWRIQIYENWDVPEDSDCTLCFAPTVVMESPPAGEYTIQWFPEPNVIQTVHEEVVVVGG